MIWFTDNKMNLILRSWICIQVLFIVTSSVNSRKTSKTGITKTECHHLEKSILKFIKTCKGPNLLLQTWNLESNVDRPAILALEKVLKMDLYSKKDVHRLTATICQARSRAFLSYALRVDIARVDEFYDQYITPVKTYGRLNSFKKTAKLFIKLLEWTLRTGYPMVPLYRIRKRQTQRFLEGIQHEMTSDPRVRKALRGTMYPLAYDPEYASAALTEANSVADLANMLQIPEVWLRAFGNKMQPRRIAHYIRSTRHILRLYRVADKLGLLDLE